MKTTRVFQITALLLLIVSVIQVGWWVYDQHDYSTQKLRDARTAYAREVAAAQALLAAGAPAPRVHELLPDVAIMGGRAARADAVDAALVEERYRRINQYAWESGFFLLALALCVGVIWRALHAETKVVQEQDSFGNPTTTAETVNLSSDSGVTAVFVSVQRVSARSAR